VVALGAAVVVALGAAVVVALGAAVVVALGAMVARGVVGSPSAMTCEGPNEVNERATAAARATETAGYATAARRRMRRAGSLFTYFTGDSLGSLVLGKRLRVVR
jgi:hypothetical protein